MKLRTRFGSDDIQDFLRESQAIAATSREKTVRDPWPDDRVLYDPNYPPKPGTTPTDE